jgi:ATP-dependent Zn protease
MKGAAPTPRATPRLAAYHEAGHAVGCFFRPLGGRTTWITIRPSDLAEDDAGAHYCCCTLAAEAGPPPDLETVRAAAVVALAGTEVDRRLTGNELTCGSADYEEVRELLVGAVLDREIEQAVAAVSEEEARERGLQAIAAEAAAAVEERFKRASDELRRQAHDLIEAKWPHVEAVAEALLERGALGGDEVRAIIAEVEATTVPAVTHDPSRPFSLRSSRGSIPSSASSTRRR